MTLLHHRLEAALGLTDELAGTLDAQALRARNGAAPSNTTGGQVWCIVGARESYVRAVEQGTWAGFTCSLVEPHDPDAVRGALARSSDLVRGLTESVGEPTTAQEELLFSLLEHEAQHHGQLIRYFYANALPFPESFASRYALG